MANISQFSCVVNQSVAHGGSLPFCKADTKNPGSGVPILSRTRGIGVRAVTDLEAGV